MYILIINTYLTQHFPALPVCIYAYDLFTRLLFVFFLLIIVFLFIPQAFLTVIISEEVLTVGLTTKILNHRLGIHRQMYKRYYLTRQSLTLPTAVTIINVLFP